MLNIFFILDTLLFIYYLEALLALETKPLHLQGKPLAEFTAKKKVADTELNRNDQNQVLE